jgi:ribosome-associated protein
MTIINLLGVTAIPPRTTTKKSAPAKKPVKAASTKPVKKTTAKKASAKPAAAKSKKSVPVKAAAKKTAAPKLSPAQTATAALCKKIAGVLDSNKAEEITTLNLRDKCSFADYMIVASGRAPRHVSALADYVADMLKKTGIPPLSVEGKESGDWVLIDAGDIVVHIFRPEVRQFYNIEKMWSLPASAY